MLIILHVKKKKTATTTKIEKKVTINFCLWNLTNVKTQVQQKLLRIKDLGFISFARFLAGIPQ